MREGGSHTVYVNVLLRKASTVPRHREVDDHLARKTCKSRPLKRRAMPRRIADPSLRVLVLGRARNPIVKPRPGSGGVHWRSVTPLAAMDFLDRSPIDLKDPVVKMTAGVLGGAVLVVAAPTILRYGLRFALGVAARVAVQALPVVIAGLVAGKVFGSDDEDDFDDLDDDFDLDAFAAELDDLDDLD